MAPHSYRGPLANDGAEPDTHSQTLEAVNDSDRNPPVSFILGRAERTSFTISPDTPVLKVIELMRKRDHRALVVGEEGGKPLGIVTDRDIVKGLSAMGLEMFGASVSAIMTKSLVSCSSSDRLVDVTRKMVEGKFRHMPVVDHGRLVGLISVLDLLRERVSELEYENLKIRQAFVG